MSDRGPLPVRHVAAVSEPPSARPALRPRAAWRSACLSAAVALVVLGLAGSVRAEYLLSPGDTLRLRALRWDSQAAVHQDWQGLSGDYVVDQEGWISIPLVGELRAAGESTRALAERIGEVVQRRVGTAEPPLVALEIAAHTPVYVLGAVAAPGAYPFRPGLTVQQAVALSGGHSGPGAAGNDDFGGETVRADGEVQLLSARIADLEARRSRLAADLALLGDDDDEPVELPALESRILDAVEAGRQAEAESLREQRATLEAERATLVAQIALIEKQLADAESELADVTSLRERGLTVNARVSALTAQANNLESQRLQLETARLRATLQLNEAERALRALGNDARAERLAELSEVERDLAESRIRLKTARALRDVALSRAGAAAAGPVEVAWRHRVTRLKDGERVTLDLAPTDPLMPGDTLEVVMEFPEG